MLGDLSYLTYAFSDIAFKAELSIKLDTEPPEGGLVTRLRGSSNRSDSKIIVYVVGRGIRALPLRNIYYLKLLGSEEDLIIISL